MNHLCRHCGESFLPCRSVSRQEYCSQPSCQKARKRLWQKQRLAKDPDYSDNQKSSQKAWRGRNSSYMRDYRARSQEYVKRNRLQQKNRNTRRKKLCVTESVLPSLSSSLIVNMDELKAFLAGLFMPSRHLRFDPGFIVNMDELIACQQAFLAMSYRPVIPGLIVKR